MRDTILRRLDVAERQSKGESTGLKILFKLRDVPEEPFMAEARARYPGRELLVIEVVESDLASDDIAARVMVDALVNHVASKPDREEQLDHAERPKPVTGLEVAQRLAFAAAKARRDTLQ